MKFELNNSEHTHTTGYRTIRDILIYQKKNHPQKIAYRFLLNDIEEVTLTYEELFNKVQALSCIIEQYTKPQDRVLLSTLPGLDFIIGFYACLLARTIAVPIIPPATANMANRFVHILKDANPKLILFDKKTAKNLSIAKKADVFIPKRFKPFLGVQEAHSELFLTIKNQNIQTITISESPKIRLDGYQNPESESSDVAFIQYTSGSTGHPKGVMITHRNLLHNMEIIKKVVNHSEHSHVFSWLPPYHDIGLIAGIIEPLYSGVTATLMSTLDFIERPSRWVEGMSKYQCTTTGGPNFAFEQCALRTTDEVLRNLDLSRLEVVANGAEPLNWAAMELFYKRFAPSGFRQGVILPCYGLAESTVMVTGKQFLREDLLLSVDLEQLKKHKIEIGEQGNSARVLVSSGIPQMNVKIVHPEYLKECASNEVGEIWIQGDSVALGYYNNKTDTEKTFHAKIAGDEAQNHYLRSGDLGFIYKGELFVCGRIKNMIIIRGQNYYPQDIEYAVSYAHPAIRKGCVVAFAREYGGQEALVVVAEIRLQTSKKNFTAIIERIKSEISLQFQLRIHQIELVPPKTIPKTSSGKLQRIKCQELLENQHITSLYHCILENTVEIISEKEPDLLEEQAWLTQFEGACVKKRTEMLRELVLSTTARILFIPDRASIDLDKGFFELGMDTISSSIIEHTILYDSYHMITVDNEKDLVMERCRNFLNANL